MSHEIPFDPDQATDESQQGGDTDRFMPIVYEELRSIAARYLEQERSHHTLQPTEIVHEVYLRLSENPSLQWTDRAHFLAIGARCVRQVLVNHARKKMALKRGGGTVSLSLYEGHIPDSTDPVRTVDILDLEIALKELNRLDERQVRVVKLRYYSGLTVLETARVLDVSARTVDCDWAIARAWLAERLLPAR